MHDKKAGFNISVVGAGYVGMSVGVLLAQHHHVTIVDVLPEKIEMINKKKSPIHDEELSDYLSNKTLTIHATLDIKMACQSADYIIIAAPTNYDTKAFFFDTSIVEKIITESSIWNPDAYIVIKSTIPVGFTDFIRKKTGNQKIMFSPEFLRESRALYDNLYPSRIIVGVDGSDSNLMAAAKTFVQLLQECAAKKVIATLLMSFDEAEAVKLFANTYLALRVSFFNELDTYAEMKNMDTNQIIQGVCLDPRIGDYYNNPSFGYGGYCLPKDTKQLLANYRDVPQNLIEAVVAANHTRKDFIAEQVIKMAFKNHKDTQTTNSDEEECKDSSEIVVGIFRLSMKYNSDNYRQSSICGVIKRIQERNIRTILYEPMLQGQDFFCDSKVINHLDEFKTESSVIITNRYDTILNDVQEKVYTRDLFGRD